MLKACSREHQRSNCARHRPFGGRFRPVWRVCSRVWTACWSTGRVAACSGGEKMPPSSEPPAQSTAEEVCRASEAGARPRVAQVQDFPDSRGHQGARLFRGTHAPCERDEGRSDRASSASPQSGPKTLSHSEAEVASNTTPGGGPQGRGEVDGGDSSADAIGSPPEIALVVGHDGTLEALYGERLDLTSLGSLTIRRASHVEPTPDGFWTADLSPVGGPVLGPFPKRSEALDAERRWIDAHVLS